MKLTSEEFMTKVKAIIGDRSDDEALQFIEDCKDTITEEKDDFKTKYETAVKEKEELDKEWRTKYKERFFSTDANIENDNDNQDNTKNDPNFDTKSEAEKLAESITINDLFKPVK